MPIGGLKQENSFHQSDVDAVKLVTVLAIARRFRVCAIGDEADLAVLA